MTDRHLIALISATPTAIAPAEQGFAEDFPAAELWNILDDGLLPAAAAAGGVTEHLEHRMQRLIRHALTEGADAVLLTCSMYAAVAAEYAADAPVLAPDEAAFDDILTGGFRRVLVLASLDSALADTQERLRAAIAAAGAVIDVTGVSVPAAFDAAKRGDADALATALIQAAEDDAADVDAIFLAQYSLTPARGALTSAVGKPVIAGPPSAAKFLRERLDTAGTAPDSSPLGVIADDFTGAMDVATALSESGQSTVVYFGTPTSPLDAPEQHDAVVIAQKIRSVPPDVAVRTATESLRWLTDAGIRQVYYKYCSTFDSTPRGNIGPVVDALVDALGGDHGDAGGPPIAVTTPSSPRHGRTVYGGELFVHGTPLADTHMARHPITPMTDSSLPRLLTPQTPHGVDAVRWQDVTAGPKPFAAALEAARAGGARHIVVDALTDDDLLTVAQVVVDERVLAGAAGLAHALGRVRTSRRDVQRDPAPSMPEAGDRAAPGSRTVVLAGSCSARTLEQIDHLTGHGGVSFRLDPDIARSSEELARAALAWFDAAPSDAPALIYSSLPPAELRRVQEKLGSAESAQLFETALGLIAQGLVTRGVRRLLIAGGETSGAVVQALQVRGGRIGDLAAPGVPWLETQGTPQLSLLLKSGNFGEIDLFTQVAAPGSAATVSRDGADEGSTLR